MQREIAPARRATEITRNAPAARKALQRFEFESEHDNFRVGMERITAARGAFIVEYDRPESGRSEAGQEVILSRSWL
jgi:hypothetical protein